MAGGEAPGVPRSALPAYAAEVARVSGGLLGFRAISAEERTALQRVARGIAKLTPRLPERSRERVRRRQARVISAVAHLSDRAIPIRLRWVTTLVGTSTDETDARSVSAK